jgi:subtilisin family serine protease
VSIGRRRYGRRLQQRHDGRIVGCEPHDRRPWRLHPVDWKRDGYNTIAGTSMATPHVTGTAALCIATGKCSGSPSNVIAKLRNDAAAQPLSYGFVGDPNNPVTTGGRNPKTLYYGYLDYVGGY